MLMKQNLREARDGASAGIEAARRQPQHTTRARPPPRIGRQRQFFLTGRLGELQQAAGDLVEQAADVDAAGGLALRRGEARACIFCVRARERVVVRRARDGSVRQNEGVTWTLYACGFLQAKREDIARRARAATLLMMMGGRSARVAALPVRPSTLLQISPRPPALHPA